MQHPVNTLVPPADWFAQYERLSSIGILMLVMFVLLIVGKHFFQWVKDFGSRVLEQLSKQTLALENVKQSNASMEINQSRMHERLDALFRCPIYPCPLRPTDHSESIRITSGNSN